MKNIDKKYIIILLVVILFEIFICNYKSLKSYILNYKETKYDIVSQEDYKDLDGDGKEIEIEIKNIDKKIYNIYIDYTERLDVIPTETTVIVNYTDELFSDYDRNSGKDNRELKQNIIKDSEKSKYIHCDFTGDTEKIKLSFSNKIGIDINSIILNKKEPFQFNFIRVIVLTLLISSIYSIFKREFFRKQFDIKNKDQRAVLLLISVIFILILSGMMQTFIQNNNLKESNSLPNLYKKQLH